MASGHRLQPMGERRLGVLDGAPSGRLVYLHTHLLVSHVASPYVASLRHLAPDLLNFEELQLAPQLMCPLDDVRYSCSFADASCRSCSWLVREGILLF